MSELVCVGTGDAFGSGGRRQSAYLLRGPSGAVLLDCGATTGSGMESLQLPREEVDAIVVSHFHADHFGGIPLFLLAALYQDARTRPLVVAGPREVEARVRAASAALGHALDSRPWSFPIRFVELPTGRAQEVGPVRVRSFATHHNPAAHPHGLVVESGGRRIAYSGDTGWFDELPEQVSGCELFVCECTTVTRGYRFHLSLEELSERRDEFDCGRILLTHLGAEMRARRDHAGFEVADDGLVVKI